MARFRLCVLIYAVAFALVEYGFVDAIPRQECTTTACMKTVSNFVDTFLWDWDACRQFYNFTCGGYRDTSIVPIHNENTPRSLAQKLNDLNIKSGGNCPWPNCATRPEDKAAAQYEDSCSKQGEEFEDGLKDFVDLLNEANKIEKWADLENWSVSQGLQSSFFKTYKAVLESDSYYEVIADADPPQYYAQLHRPAVVDPDTIIIDLRPDMAIFGVKDDDRVAKYIGLLKAANLSHELERNLLDGFKVSRQLDQKLIEQHTNSKPADHGLNFFRQRYTRYSRKGNPPVHWQHLWDCGGLYFISFEGETICRSATVHKFDWTSYFRDYYWGSVAMAGDLVPLLEREIPEHWVVAPDLISAMSNTIQSYSNQRMKNVILWRIARQLTRHADVMTKSTLGLWGSYYDCHTTFLNTIMKLQSRYNWYDRFSAQTRTQFYRMWADVNFQLKYLRLKRLYKKGKDQGFEDMKSFILMNYTKTEYYPQFPRASKYVEPSVVLKETHTNWTTLNLALNLRKVERSLLLRSTRVEYTYNDTYYLTETLGTTGFERFMEDRPASLNYGALGSAIGYNLMKRFIKPWRNNLNFFNNYKVCVDKNFPGFIGNNYTKLHELASIMFGVEAAWYAYKQHAAIHGEKNLRMPLGRAVEISDGDITEYDNKKLFFASFGNSLCGSMHSAEMVNVAMTMLPQFHDAFECGPNYGGPARIECQFD